MTDFKVENFDNNDFSIILEENNSKINNNINTISFFVEKNEKLRITKEGFYIEGRLASKDSDIYDAFKLWLEKNNKL